MGSKKVAIAATDSTRWNLLQEPLIRWRSKDQGKLHYSSLPQLFAAMQTYQVRDFPALRPHQRHPWHAFLVQLGAIAMHHAKQKQTWECAEDWRAAFRALTPYNTDDAPWCLVSPADSAALLQAPAPGETPAQWGHPIQAADALDMLVTAKNHGLKVARVRASQADDWLFTLVSLQTQEGFLGAGNYGISRMNGGFANRPGLGIAAMGTWGERWQSDLYSLLAQRARIASTYGFTHEKGHALLWQLPWSGADSLDLQTLDPLYIEVCRRVRLCEAQGQLQAHVTGSKVTRIAARNKHGATGDAWTPVMTPESKALTLSHTGFDYRILTELLMGEKFIMGAAWQLDAWAQSAQLQVIAQTIVRGEGKTHGYHERRIPISAKMRSMLTLGQQSQIRSITQNRIKAIADMGKLLWSSLVLWFANGNSHAQNDTVNKRASRFSRPFEQYEDARFFDDLTIHIDAQEEQHDAVYLQWQIGLAARAHKALTQAFVAGPRCSIQRYKAQSIALARFHTGLSNAFPDLVPQDTAKSSRTSDLEGARHV